MGPMGFNYYPDSGYNGGHRSMSFSRSSSAGKYPTKKLHWYCPTLNVKKKTKKTAFEAPILLHNAGTTCVSFFLNISFSFTF